MLALALNALLWWTYFGGDDRRATVALEAGDRVWRGRAALVGYGPCHLALLGGVIAVAAGLTEVVAEPGHVLRATAAIELAGGVALFLLGDAALRRTLRIGDGIWRALAGVVVLATIPLGLAASGWLMLAALVAVFAVALAIEPRSARVPMPA
jgi:low temperature requirement protein LtrA